MVQTFEYYWEKNLRDVSPGYPLDPAEFDTPEGNEDQEVLWLPPVQLPEGTVLLTGSDVMKVWPKIAEAAKERWAGHPVFGNSEIRPEVIVNG